MQESVSNKMQIYYNLDLEVTSHSSNNSFSPMLSSKQAANDCSLEKIMTQTITSPL